MSQTDNKNFDNSHDEKRTGRFIEDRADKPPSPHGHQSLDTYRNDAPTTTGAQTAKLENALAGLSKEEIFAGVDTFTKQHELEEFNEAFRKGALLAQRPLEWDNIDELIPEDRAVIEQEHMNKWKHPWSLYYTGELDWVHCHLRVADNPVIVCAIGAACQGWDQTGSNGASKFSAFPPPSSFTLLTAIDLSFPQEFGIATPIGQPGGEAAEWRVGFVNAGPYIGACLLWVSSVKSE